MQVTRVEFSDRLEIIEVPSNGTRATFSQDVAAGLSAAQKHLSSVFFYDELGSALFDAITRLPEYYLTRAETEILHESGWEIVRALEEPVEFLELGSGSAIKTRILIEEALRAQGRLRYSPIDVSEESLRASASQLIDTYPALRVRAYAADYFDVLDSPKLELGRRVLAMFMGSNIGNYAPVEAGMLLERIAGRLRPGDGLLIGADSIKDPAALESAYDDPTGVTAAFNKNLLGRMNRELGADFDLREFAHVAAYVPDKHCVESFLEARSAQSVRIGAVRGNDGFALTVGFKKGERIHTESSYKFDRETIERMAAKAGFRLSKEWTDRAQRFGVYLLRR